MPRPADTSRVDFPMELNELREILACNVHEIWAMETLKLIVLTNYKIIPNK